MLMIQRIMDFNIHEPTLTHWWLRCMLSLSSPQIISSNLTTLTTNQSQMLPVEHYSTQYLQHEVPVWGQCKVQVLVLQMFSEGQQELVLSADVSSQNQRAQLLLDVLSVDAEDDTELTNLDHCCRFNKNVQHKDSSDISTVWSSWQHPQCTTSSCLWIVKSCESLL